MRGSGLHIPLDLLDELIHVKGLGDEVVGAGVSRDALGILAGGEDDDGNGARRVRALELPADLAAVAAGQADVEQDDSVAEYFADRTEEMGRRVAADEARMAALAAEAEEVRIAMVTEELDTTVASYNDVLRTMVEQLAALDAQVAHAASLSQHAEELAGTLPASAARQHQAVDAVATRTAEIGERLQALQEAVSVSVPSPQP